MPSTESSGAGASASQAASPVVMGPSQLAMKIAMEDLRSRLATVEQENTRLHEKDLARETAEREFFEKVAPSLALLGHGPPRSGVTSVACGDAAARFAAAAAEVAAASPKVARARLEEVAAALAEASRHITSPQSSVTPAALLASTSAREEELTARVQQLEEALRLAEAERLVLRSAAVALWGLPGRTQVSCEQTLLSLLEDALMHALNGKVALETWLASRQGQQVLVQLAQPGLEGRSGREGQFLGYLHSVAALKDAASPAPPPQRSKSQACSSFLYKPVYNDSVDCLLASELMKLAAQGALGIATPRIERLSPGLYRFGGPGGPTLVCRVDGGKVLIQPAAPADGGDATHVPALELGEFLARHCGEAAVAG